MSAAGKQHKQQCYGNIDQSSVWQSHGLLPASTPLPANRPGDRQWLDCMVQRQVYRLVTMMLNIIMVMIAPSGNTGH